jgi:hypothetical protein
MEGFQVSQPPCRHHPFNQESDLEESSGQTAGALFFRQSPIDDAQMRTCSAGGVHVVQTFFFSYLDS